MGSDGKVHVTKLDASDHVSGASIVVPGNDFSDLAADDAGGVVLLTRSQECGAPSALCGVAPNPPIPCSGMYLVRFDDAGKEVWATRLTNPNVPYPTAPTSSGGTRTTGESRPRGRATPRISGQRFRSPMAPWRASTFTRGSGEGRRPRRSGAVRRLGLGCSHSGYERVIWDPIAKRYAAVCKTDNQNRIMFNVSTEVRKLDLWYSNVGNLVPSAGGYWLTTSDIEPGQPASAEGTPTCTCSSSPRRQTEAARRRLPGSRHRRGSRLERARAAPRRLWRGSPARGVETTSKVGDIARQDAGRKLHVQTRSRATGEAEGAAFAVDVLGNRYQEMIAFPDGSVAFPAPGSSGTKVKILRILPCAG